MLSGCAWTRVTVKGTPHDDRSQHATARRTLDPLRDRQAQTVAAGGAGPHRARGAGRQRRRRPARRRRLGGPGRRVHVRDQGPGARVPRLPAQPAAPGRRGRRLGRRPGRRRPGRASRRATGAREGRHRRRLLLAVRHPGPARRGRPRGADRRPHHGRREGRRRDPGAHRTPLPRRARPGGGHRRRPGRRAARDADGHPGGPDPGRADRPAGDARAAGDGLRQRRRGPAAARHRHRRHPRDERDPARPHRAHRRLRVRDQPHHGPRPRTRRRLRAVHRPPLPRGTVHRRRAPDRDRHDAAHRRAHGAVLRSHGRGVPGGDAGLPAVLPAVCSRRR